MSHYQYKTLEVRDLAWACFSPALLHSAMLGGKEGEGQSITNCGLRLTPQRQNWLQHVDNYPAGLQKHLEKRHNSRLGLYFECLWHFFLQEDTEVDLIAHNLPIRDTGRTLGEFDCLYFCRQRKSHFHLELAVKYYLGYRHTTTGEQNSRWDEWLGPTNTDHLDRKIKHLTQQQIQLGNHPAAKQALAELGISTLKHEIEVKGYLFQALDDPLPAPYAHNPQNKLCHWLNIDQLEGYLKHSDRSNYRILPKSQWLAPATASAGKEQLMGQQETLGFMAKYFQQDQRPQLLAAFDASGDECQRFFVTDRDWPRFDK